MPGGNCAAYGFSLRSTPEYHYIGVTLQEQRSLCYYSK